MTKELLPPKWDIVLRYIMREIARADIIFHSSRSIKYDLKSKIRLCIGLKGPMSCSLKQAISQIAKLHS